MHVQVIWIGWNKQITGFHTYCLQCSHEVKYSCSTAYILRHVCACVCLLSVCAIIVRRIWFTTNRFSWGGISLSIKAKSFGMSQSVPLLLLVKGCICPSLCPTTLEPNNFSSYQSYPVMLKRVDLTLLQTHPKQPVSAFSEACLYRSLELFDKGLNPFILLAVFSQSQLGL